MIGSGAAVGVAAVAAGVGVMVSGGVIANQLCILMAIDMHGIPNSTVVVAVQLANMMKMEI